MPVHEADEQGNGDAQRRSANARVKDRIERLVQRRQIAQFGRVPLCGVFIQRRIRQQD